MTSKNQPLTLAQLPDLEKPSVIMMAGVPGSGKSYIAEQLSSLLDYPILSADDIRMEITGSAIDNSVNAETWHILHARAEALLASEQSVIIDATQAEQYRRQEEVLLYRSMGARAIACIEVQTHYDTLVQRNEARDKFIPLHAIDRMRRNLRQQPPAIDDGFDGVIRIAN